MSDAQNIERAKRLIEGWIGEVEQTEFDMDYNVLMMDVHDSDETFDREIYNGLIECGEWAVKVALDQLKEVYCAA